VVEAAPKTAVEKVPVVGELSSQKVSFLDLCCRKGSGLLDWLIITPGCYSERLVLSDTYFLDICGAR